jgi:glycosyltransferase involved in cell wall biosynthesis
VLRDGVGFDLVWAELATARYASLAAPGAALVLDTHNVESGLVGSFAAAARPPLRWLGMLEAARTRAFERATCRSAWVVFCISPDDLADLSHGLDGDRFVVRPPVARRCPDQDAQPDGRTIVFVGQMSWAPNEEAIRWFADEVLPLAAAEGLDVRVRVAGAGMTGGLREHLTARGVEVLGYVDDIWQVYRDATVFVAPFRSGSGVRMKMLEAMSAGTPVVSTAAGLKGLRAVPGRDLLVADEPRAFAAAVRAVLADARLAADLARNARGYLRRGHSHEAAVATIREVLERIGRACPELAVPGGRHEAVTADG